MFFRTFLLMRLLRYASKETIWWHVRKVLWFKRLPRRFAPRKDRCGDFFSQVTCVAGPGLAKTVLGWLFWQLASLLPESEAASGSSPLLHSSVKHFPPSFPRNAASTRRNSPGPALFPYAAQAQAPARHRSSTSTRLSHPWFEPVSEVVTDSLYR